MKKIIFTLILLLLPNNVILHEDVANIIPGGENIGIEIKPKGVVVIGSYDVTLKNIKYNPAKDSDIIKGDLIYMVNKDLVDDVSSMLDAIKKYINDDYVNLKILRNNQEITRKLNLIRTSSANTIKTGLLVKERILGIGTVTFYDSESKIYGALGHKLIDNDFSSITDVNSGTIFASNVTGINKSYFGNVGELISTINENEKLGNVFLNTDYGVFGHYNECPDKDALETLKRDEVKLGNAYIYTTLDGSKAKQYSIEITSLLKQDKISTKGISFKITDKELLNKTGGIVQGMSGSPIIQDNKIVGAVTHVLVDSVKRGYGIYIDFMLETAKIG
ncbi:MAG: SpoIVB peptidase [Candidatus Caccosoma sp.]|nr:SpoIVB peptidase [Candidatus Caccosoma sp.]